jgi:hypothetical protein
VVVHAGEIHYDTNGCFGEALDIAFRLLDAAHVKKALQAAADPLILVISHRYPGWIHIPVQSGQHQVTELARYRQLA